MEGPDLLQQVRVLLRRERVGVVGNPDLQGLDLGGLRHPVRHTQQVEMQHTADQGTARQHNAQALPAAPEHLEGLGQQHGGAVIPDGPCRQQADHHGQRVVVFPLLEAIPEQGVEELAAQQGTEPCHTVPEHRPQPAHGHHVAGGLTAAPAVEDEGQGSQRQSYQGVDADQPEALQVCGGQKAGGVRRSIGERLLDLHILPGAPDVVDQIHGGREPLHHPGVISGKAEDEPLGEGGDQPVQQHRQEVEQGVQRRHGEGVAGDEGHEGGAGEVEEALTQHCQDGDGQPLGVKGPAAQGDHDAQDPGDRVGNQGHGEAGEEVGEEQPFPPDRQGVHQPHAAGVV